MKTIIPSTLLKAFDVLLAIVKAVVFLALLIGTLDALEAIWRIPAKLDAIVFRLTDQARGIAHVSDQLTLLRGQQAYDARMLRQQLRGDTWTCETTSGVTVLSLSPDIRVPFAHFTTNAINGEGIAVRSQKD